MYWYVIHTKPRQERRALLNLIQQGYECYLPILTSEKIQKGNFVQVEEPLFSRYLFIRLDTGLSAKSWTPIRSTKGVSHLVTFGAEPARLNDEFIDTLRMQVASINKQPKGLFTLGEKVLITTGPFAGLEAVYQMSNGENRAMVFIEILSKLTRLDLPPDSFEKIPN